jgi:hypothetical protein
MAYIGQSIKNGTFSVLDTSGNTYNGSNTTFSLGTQVGSAAQLLVSHDGVIQKPGTDYTLATGGTQITFTTAPASGASIFIVEISGAVGGPMNRDLNGEELILDVDGDSSIHADTDDQIDFRAGGTDTMHITNGKVGVGIASAARTFHVHDDTQPYIHMSNNTTGTSTSDGFDILVDNSTGKVILNQRENQPIEFFVNNTESLQLETDGDLTFVRAGTGIHLGVTSATAANLLNDYEEGTFTPTLGGASSDPTVGYATQSGKYTKIGNTVFIDVIVYLNSISGGGGNANIRGLPFTSNNRGTGSMIFDRMRIQASYQNEVTPYVENNATYVAIAEMNDAIDEARTHVQIDDIRSDTYIMFSAKYTTDS